jgi:hypothetical protein
MNRRLLQSLFLRAASLLVARDQRQDWLEEWHSELWYMRPESALRACLGSVTDAMWLRRNTDTVKKSLVHSASGCLAALLAAGAAGLFAANWLLAPLGERATLWRLSPRDLLPANILTLALSLVFLLLAPLVGLTSRLGRHLPRQGRVRRTLFFAAKLIAVQPVMLCGLFMCIMTASTLPFAPFGVIAVWYVILRWVMHDQQRRCPTCLRLLDPPVRIGTRSSIFLECHVAESACPEAHGLLHLPESETSYPATAKWLTLNPSWHSLFCTRTRSGRI